MKLCPSRALDLPHALVLELQSVRCGALGAEVPGHSQEQLTQTLIVRLLNTRYLDRKALLSRSPTAILTFKWTITYPTPSVFHADQHGGRRFLLYGAGAKARSAVVPKYFRNLLQFSKRFSPRLLEFGPLPVAWQAKQTVSASACHILLTLAKFC